MTAPAGSGSVPPVDLDEIEARTNAATEGPWLIGDRWHVAGVLPERFGAGKCGACRPGQPIVWEGRRGINGKKMLAHVHQTDEPWYGDGHTVYSYSGGPDVACIAGNYGYEEGGIVSAIDAEFIAAARTDVPAMLAELRTLRAENERLTERDLVVEKLGASSEQTWDAWQSAVADLLELRHRAASVMETLEQHGPGIVGHLLDTDDNAGERLRQLLARLATTERAI